MRILKRSERLFVMSVLIAVLNMSYFILQEIPVPQTKTIIYPAMQVVDEHVEVPTPRFECSPQVIEYHTPELGPEIEKEDLFTGEDDKILMKIAMAEARVDGVEGMALVMRVVLNRQKSSEFPDSLDEIVHQKNQFSVVSSGKYDEAIPDEECYQALELIKQGEYEDMPALFFDSCKDGESWAAQHRPFYDQIGNHNFYR